VASFYPFFELEGPCAYGFVVVRVLVDVRARVEVLWDYLRASERVANKSRKESSVRGFKVDNNSVVIGALDIVDGLESGSCDQLLVSYRFIGKLDIFRCERNSVMPFYVLVKVEPIG